jgi:hypothetical protein
MGSRSRVQISGRLVLCLVLGAAVTAPTLTIAKPRDARTQGVDPDWLTYRNERYAFRLSYPADSRVDTRREHGFQHISISSNAVDEAQATPAPTYRIDVLIYDHRLGHRLKFACRELLRDARTVKVGKVQGLRGVHQEGEDEASAAQAVCVESTKLDIVVKAVDGDPQVPLADRILDSVRFGD